jgi:uncharacterized protein (DUF433 family)
MASEVIHDHTRIVAPNEMFCCLLLTTPAGYVVEWKEMSEAAVKIDPAIMHGVPCFHGTRVPVKHLFEFVEAGRTIDEFLRQFPTVKREQATRVLETAREQLDAWIRGAA